MRATGTPAEARASSTATRLGWSRPDPAPGVSRTAQRGRVRRRPDGLTGASLAAQEDALGLRQVVDARPGPVAVPAVVGMGGADHVAEAAHDLAPGGFGPHPEAEDGQGPARAVAHPPSDTEGSVLPREVAHELVVGLALPAGGPPQQTEDKGPGPGREPGRGVDGGQHLGQRGAVVVEAEGHGLTDGRELVTAAVEADHVGLEAVPEPGLQDASPQLEVGDEALQAV